MDSISSDARVMSGGLQPNLALDHKPLFPEFVPYLLCQHERTFSPAYGEQSVIGATLRSEPGLHPTTSQSSAEYRSLALPRRIELLFSP